MDDIELARSSYNEMHNGPKSEEQDKESVENFQKFFYELFEKNGILNDLRAYLRRHIVEVLKNSNAGDTPMCQKHFSQRLELKAQAINILIAEYLLHSELSYTLSVFVSEIPLANMLFDFAGSLMKGDGGSELYFKDKDIWSIVHYLGIKCDSKVISSIKQMYRNEKQPLLLCILKNLPTVPTDIPCVDPVSSSEDALSDHSSETMSEKTSKKFAKLTSKCQHYALCRSCHYRLIRLKEKYKRRKESEKTKEPSIMSMNVNSLMKNISNIEGSLVNEMFDQLKSVYETEIDMLRAKQERRVQEALQEHVYNMEQQRRELEEAFKAREEDLERGVRAKKKFLWGLARSLRAQHDHLARAMLAVKYHTQRLKAKEENLKAQLIEVEHLMQTRGEDMQVQISSELVALQRQLDSVKMEREAVNKEKAELEHLRHEITSNHANIDIDEIAAISDSAWSNFNLLKNEVSTLRKFTENGSQDDKCTTEQNTVEDTGIQSTRRAELLNNEQEVKVVREEDKRLKNNQLVNDFKKKNVNFCVGNAEEKERQYPAEERRTVDEEVLSQLSQENERLREYARQQEQQVSELSSRAARLQRELSAARAPRPRTAPPTHPTRPTRAHLPPDIDNSNDIAPNSQMAWRCKGAGEDTALFKSAVPQVYLPGDTVPFIGLLYDRHAEPKRLMNQWRTARRTSPLRARRAPSPSPAPAAHQPLPAHAHEAADPPAPAPAPRAPPPPPPPADNTPAANTRDHAPDAHDKTYPEESHAFTRNDNHPHPDQQADLIPNLDEPFSRVFFVDVFSEPQVPPATPTAPPAPAPARSERARSPKSMLRDAKERLRTYPNAKKFFTTPPSTSARDESPTTVLREAKLRLRKLEIEAEAVEKSYMDYRKRQNELRNERELTAPVKEEAIVTKDVGDLTTKNDKQKTGESRNSIKNEIHAFLQEYRRRLHVSDTEFSNKNATVTKIKPIPEAFSPGNVKNAGRGNNEHVNYLESPLAEFQKYYKTSESFTKPRTVDGDQETRNKHRPVQRPFAAPIVPPSPAPIPAPDPDPAPTGDSLATEVKQLEAKKEALIKAKNSKKVELEILKMNVTKMYNYDDDADRKEDVVSQDVEQDATASVAKDDDCHSLRIEVENLKETNEIKVEAEPKHVLVVVKSNVETTTTPSDVEDNKKLRGNMTILISPKHSPNYLNEPKQQTPRCVSPEQAAKLTRNDVLEAIFQADPVKANSVEEVGDAVSKANDSDGEGDDYQDDFSADVDNYDYSRTDCTRSPVSLAAQEPDDMWDDSQTFP